MVKVGGVDQAAQNGLAHSYLEERTSFLYMHISNTVNVQNWTFGLETSQKSN